MNNSKKYYFLRGQNEAGPYTIGQIRNMWQNGTITGDMPYREDQESEWTPLIEIVELLEPQNVSITQAPPFAHLHTPIQGKKGKITPIGETGIIVGALFSIGSLVAFFTCRNNADIQNAFFCFVIGLVFVAISYLWAREEESNEEK